jgi:hypothetical protein
MSSPLIIQARVEVDVPDALMAWLVQFAEFAGEAKMGLTCNLCKSPIVGGAHGLNDPHLTMSCGCRSFKGINPNVLMRRREQQRLTEQLKDGSADLPV